MQFVQFWLAADRGAGLNVALAEAPSYGQSILKYNKNSRGSLAYLALAGEVLRRDAKQNHYINQ